jgi:hypothetical protein
MALDVDTEIDAYICTSFPVCIYIYICGVLTAMYRVLSHAGVYLLGGGWGGAAGLCCGRVMVVAW